MSEMQLEVRTRPLSNAQGVAQAIAQIDGLKASPWDVVYDRHVDTLFLRRAGAGPAVSYFHEEDPDLVFRLDPVTSELIGVDVTDLARSFVKRHPEFKVVLRHWRLSRLMARIPGLRSFADVVRRGVGDVSEQQVGLTTSRLCHT